MLLLKGSKTLALLQTSWCNTSLTGSVANLRECWYAWVDTHTPHIRVIWWSAGKDYKNGVPTPNLWASLRLSSFCLHSTQERSQTIRIQFSRFILFFLSSSCFPTEMHWTKITVLVVFLKIHNPRTAISVTTLSLVSGSNMSNDHMCAVCRKSWRKSTPCPRASREKEELGSILHTSMIRSTVTIRIPRWTHTRAHIHSANTEWSVCVAIER